MKYTPIRKSYLYTNKIGGPFRTADEAQKFGTQNAMWANYK